MATGAFSQFVTSRRSSSCRPRRPGDATETSSETRVWGNHCCGCSWGPCSQSGGDPHARQDSPECARSSATAPGTSVLNFVTGRIVSRETAESERKEIPMRSIAVLGVLVGLVLVACWAPTAAAATLPAGTAGNALILPVDPYVAAAEVSTSIVLAKFCDCPVSFICTNRPQGFECSEPPTCCHCSGSPGARVCVKTIP